MTLDKYNKLQIQRIKNFAKLCHEDADIVAPLWVEMYSEKFCNRVKKLENQHGEQHATAGSKPQ